MALQYHTAFIKKNPCIDGPAVQALVVQELPDLAIREDYTGSSSNIHFLFFLFYQKPNFVKVLPPLKSPNKMESCNLG